MVLMTLVVDVILVLVVPLVVLVVFVFNSMIWCRRWFGDFNGFGGFLCLGCFWFFLFLIKWFWCYRWFWRSWWFWWFNSVFLGNDWTDEFLMFDNFIHGVSCRKWCWGLSRWWIWAASKGSAEDLFGWSISPLINAIPQATIVTSCSSCSLFLMFGISIQLKQYNRPPS